MSVLTDTQLKLDGLIPQLLVHHVGFQDGAKQEELIVAPRRVLRVHVKSTSKSYIEWQI